MESRCLLIFLFRYVIAAGLENGRIQLLSSVDMQQLDQWGLWHSLDERYKRERERERELVYGILGIYFFIILLFRLCHYGVVRSLSWRQPTSNNLLQLASGGEDHSVRILNVEY